jgi:hypothetical protein
VRERHWEPNAELHHQAVLVLALEEFIARPCLAVPDLVDLLLDAEQEGHHLHEGRPDGGRRLNDVVLPILGCHGDGLVEEGGGHLDGL